MASSSRGAFRKGSKYKLALIMLLTLPTFLVAWFSLKEPPNTAQRPTDAHRQSAAISTAGDELPVAPHAAPAADGCTGPHSGYLATDLPPSTSYRYADAATAACSAVPMCSGVVLGGGEKGRYTLRQGHTLKPSPNGEVSYCCRVQCAAASNQTVPSVLILTPVKVTPQRTSPPTAPLTTHSAPAERVAVQNAAAHLERYFQNLYNLTYPGASLSVALLDSRCL